MAHSKQFDVRGKISNLNWGDDDELSESDGTETPAKRTKRIPADPQAKAKQRAVKAVTAGKFSAGQMTYRGMPRDQKLACLAAMEPVHFNRAVTQDLTNNELCAILYGAIGKKRSDRLVCNDREEHVTCTCIQGQLPRFHRSLHSIGGRHHDDITPLCIAHCTLSQ